jgi:multidrug resistance efflux pump
VQRVPVKIYFDEAAVKAFRDKLLPGLSVTAEVNIRAPEDPSIVNVTR